MNEIHRNLDGIYFRIGCENICFSDLTEGQQDEVLMDRSEKWLKSMCKHLAKVIKDIGNQFDLVCQ